MEAVLDIAIRNLTKELDKFISSCIDEKGSIKTPSKRDFMRIRGTLPNWCVNTLIKVNK